MQLSNDPAEIALAFDVKDQDDKPIAKLSWLLQRDPNRAKLWAARAGCFAARNEPEKAAADFDRALSLIPVVKGTWHADREGIDDQIVPLDDVFNHLVKLRPKDVSLWIARSRRFAHLGQFRDAAAAAAKTLELDPTDVWSWFHDAPLRLQLDDIDGYRRDCGEMLKRFGDTGDPNLANLTALTCLLRPDAQQDLKPVRRLAELIVTNTEGEGVHRWFLTVRGLADYRAGQFTPAIEWLNRVAPDPKGDSLDATAFVVLAMARHQKGQSAEAGTALARAQNLLEQRLHQLDIRGGPFNSWNDWLRCQILAREAEVLITGKVSPATK